MPGRILAARGTAIPDPADSDKGFSAGPSWYVSGLELAPFADLGKIDVDPLGDGVADKGEQSSQDNGNQNVGGIVDVQIQS